jgi:urease accessory protein
MKGSLHIAFEKTQTGVTVLHLRRQDPPWRVVRAFTGSSGEALVHLHNVSGGVLSGDQLELSATLSPGARAQITTTGATRIYRRRAGAGEAQSTAYFNLAEGSLLELLPDTIIPYGGSAFAQKTTVNLAQGATLFWWEALAPGREASGEVFRFEQLRMETEIRAEGVPIAIDRALLNPHLRPLDPVARLGNCRHLATLYCCRAGEALATWRRLEECLNSISSRLMEAEDGVRWGISPLVRDGVLVRGISPHGPALLSGLREFWKAARLLLTGEPASLPRKIY